MRPRRSIARTGCMLALAASFAGVFFANTARADTTEQCVRSATNADRLRRDTSTFRAARDALHICASDECPELIRNDCRLWLSDVEAAIPTVVLVAEDEAAAPLLETRVDVDGATLDQPLDGRPLQLDVGLHTFVFRRGDQSIERTTVLVPHQKDVLIRVRFEPSGSKPLTEPNHYPPASPTYAPRSEAPATSAPPRSPLTAIGLAVAAGGIVGLGFGTYFGLLASEKQDAADCPNNRCGAGSRPDELRDAQSAGNLSTAFFIAGGALTAGGVALVLLSPNRSNGSSLQPQSKTGVALVPFGGGLKVELQTF